MTEKNNENTLGHEKTVQGESKPKADDLETRSLGDQVTFSGGRAPQRDQSLGDQITLGGGDVIDGGDLGDGMEVVDLSARYKVERTLGKGGMGEVVLATDTRLGRKVAIKRILGEAARNRAAINRFLTEAQAVAAMNHPNIVQIHDYGRDQEGPFLIMEYVEGDSLLERCREQPLPVDKAVELTCELLSGLGRAHELGIIHRDIKPANILLTKDGRPKLTDFGLAKKSAADAGRTLTGAVLGTIDFMPPEQRRDAGLVDARSDLWSLAATLYQMVTGESPKVIRIKKVPAQLQDVLDRALEESKAARYQTAREFRDALRASLAAVTEPEIEAAVDLGIGECSQCHTKNDASRKFCRECAASLRVSCLNCSHEIPFWDKVCPECGGKQADLVVARLNELQQQHDQAEQLRSEYGYEAALEIAKKIAAVDDRRLSQHKSWSEEFLEATKAEWERQQEAAQQHFVEAQKHREVFDYPAAFRSIESIPEALRTPNVDDYLRVLRSDYEESHALYGDITEKIQQRMTSGLQPQIERFRTLRGTPDDFHELLDHLRCPKCQAPNEVHRYSCRECGEVLSCNCLKCQHEIPVWDKVCSECGGKQADLVAARLSELKQQRDRAEQLRSEYGYEAALEIAQKIAAVDDRRLSQHQAWSNEFLKATKTEWERQKESAWQLFKEARRHREAFDYDAAIHSIQSIPDPMRSSKVNSYLKGLESDQNESVESINTIMEGIKRRDLEGLLPVAERAVALRGDREDLRRLLGRLREREAKLIQTRDKTFTEAEKLVSEGKATEAMRLVDRVRTTGLTDAQLNLRTRLQAMVAAERELFALVQDANKGGVIEPKEVIALLARSIECLNLNPHHAGIRQLHEDVLKRLPKCPSDVLARLPVNILARLPVNILAQLPVVLWGKLPDSVFILVNSIGMKLKLLPAGTFTMGSAKEKDETPHQVTLTKPFYMGVYEVTQEQYERVLGKNPSNFNAAQNPVEQVSWDDAVEFCRRISALPEEKAAGRVYRLPTEAEWEYACRAGSKTGYCFGDNESQLGEYAWYDKNSGNKTHPVGEKRPNGWGLYDMHGNVWEWCADWYGNYPQGAVTDPVGPNGGSDRVIRGGGWFFEAALCRSAPRYGIDPSSRSSNYGFRVALSSSGIPE